MEDNQNNPITNAHSMWPKNLPQTSQPVDGSQDNQEKLAALARLQSHYYQPGQSREQLNAIFQDMLEDLAHLTPAEVQIACRRYRADGTNRFFPTPGQLLDNSKAKPAPVVQHSNLKRFDQADFHSENVVPPGQLKAPYLILMEKRGMSFEAAMASQNKMFPNGFPNRAAKQPNH